MLVLPRCFAGAAAVPDAEGCKDLALFTRVNGCVIIECSSKQKDSIPFQVNAQLERAIEGDSASVQYTCAGEHPPGQIAKKMASVMSKSGYTVVFRDTEDPASALITARKGAVWVQLSANTDDNGTLYSVTSVDSASQVFNPEPCSDPGLFAMPAGCRVTECRAKKDDRVEMRTGATGQAALIGTTRTLSIGCQTAVNTAQFFESAQTGFHSAGLNVLFSDNARPDNTWLTVRSGNRWAELISFENGDGIAYQLTGANADKLESIDGGGETVATAAVITAAKEAAKTPEVAAAAPAQPKAVPRPVEVAQVRPPVTLMPVVTVIKSGDGPMVTGSTLRSLTAASLPRAGAGPVTPPRALRRAPLALSDSAKNSIQSDVTVMMWVDVNEEGWPVASTPVSEKLSKDEVKIAEAANTSLLQWRFQPAMQAGKRVSSRLQLPMKFTRTQFRLNVPNFIH